ncbi:unnamed protein product [Trifolium pratense]|uniref:Uncharacterized protein n=1 Tax=Trifolium pratense TaxID=57577 RepID=A0ACB0K703_TRIPR|nr:unnamed protein product [Trifolium pratense]
MPLKWEKKNRKTTADTKVQNHFACHINVLSINASVEIVEDISSAFQGHHNLERKQIYELPGNNIRSTFASSKEAFPPLVASVSAMPFVGPWPCLGFSPSKVSKAPSPEVSKRSFVQALLNSTKRVNDPALKIARELDAIKNDPPKKVKQVFVPKTHEDIMQGCSKNVAFEDPLILDIIRSKEIVIERDVLDIEEELSTGISIGSYHLILEQVEEVPTVDLSDIPHVQKTPSTCRISSANVIYSDEILNPNVAHDLAILKQYWEGKDASDIGHNVYTDEEERHAATNFLNNRVATREESFTDVESKARKKKNA